MNIALPALIILSFLLSGYIYISALDRAENTTLDRKPFESSSAGAIFISLIINLFSISIANYFFPIDFQLWIKIITGSKLVESDIITISNSIHKIALFFIFNYSSSYLLGKLTQYILFMANPYKSSCLAFDTPWYYELKGKISGEKDAQIIKLSCLQDLKDGSYLYYGILEDFYLDKNGQLDRIILSDVYRRKIDKDKIESTTKIVDENAKDFTSINNENEQKDRLYQIEGDRLILKYNNLANINIEYLYVTEV